MNLLRRIMNLLRRIFKRYLISTRFPHTNIDPRSNISNSGIIEIGEYTYGYFDIICFNASDHVRIGKFCSIASGVKIFGGVSIISGLYRLFL